MTLLQLDPESTLYFTKTPLTSSPSRMLKLTNLHSGPVAFKVKTTAPKAYLVRPSSGTLKSRDTQEVQIILQPQGSDGQANNHRFLVQAVPCNSSEAVTREQWAEFPKTSIQELRLNVVLEERDEKQVESKGADTYSNPAATGGGAGEQTSDLKMKYDELVQYTLMLEKEKKRLEADMASLQSAKGSTASEGYTKFHAIIVAILAFLLSYGAKYLS